MGRQEGEGGNLSLTQERGPPGEGSLLQQCRPTAVASRCLPSASINAPFPGVSPLLGARCEQSKDALHPTPPLVCRHGGESGCPARRQQNQQSRKASQPQKACCPFSAAPPLQAAAATASATGFWVAAAATREKRAAPPGSSGDRLLLMAAAAMMGRSIRRLVPRAAAASIGCSAGK